LMREMKDDPAIAVCLVVALTILVLAVVVLVTKG